MGFIKRSFLRFVLVAALAVACATSGWAQAKLSGEVKGIDPDHGYVLRLVSGVLQDMRIYIWGVEPDSNDLLSNYTEFRAHLMPYRARFRFHVDGNRLLVTIENLQSPAKGTWTRAMIPAEGAEAKLVEQVVERLNAVNQKSMQERGLHPVSEISSGDGRSGYSGVAQSQRAKSLVFDPVPVRCAEGMCPVKRDGLWGFVDYDGNLVLDFKYHSPNFPTFSHGACVVQASDGENHPIPGFVYIDKQGNVLFGGQEFLSARPFVGDWAIVLVDEKNGRSVTAAIDRQGHIQKLPGVSSDSDFHEGLIPAQGGTGAKYGFKDSRQHWAIQPAYDQVQQFSNGLAWAAQTSAGGVQKWGAITREGRIAVPFVFSMLPAPFSEGLAAVFCTDNTQGYIDKTGALVIPCQFEQAKRFAKGVAYVRREGRALLIDVHGQSISAAVNPRLLNEGLSLRDDGLYNFFHSDVGRLTGLLDERWNVMLPAQYAFLGPYPDDEDPKALAWASSPGSTPHQGFVNRSGDFVLVAEESMF